MTGAVQNLMRKTQWWFVVDKLSQRSLYRSVDHPKKSEFMSGSSLQSLWQMSQTSHHCGGAEIHWRISKEFVLTTVVGGKIYFLLRIFGKTELFFDLSVIWTRFFILRKALHLKIILNTHIMVLRPLENFLQPFEIQKYLQKQLFSLLLWLVQNGSIREYQNQKMAISWRLGS